MYIVYTVIMKTVIMNATKARNQFFDLLEAAKYNRQITEVMLNGKKVAMIGPIEEDEFDWNKYKREMKKAVNYLSKFDWSDVLSKRKRWKIRRYRGW